MEKKYGFRRTRASERPLYHNATIIHLPDMEGQRKVPNWSADNTIGPKLRERIERCVKNCDTCQRSKAVRHAPYGLLQPNEVPGQPWRSIAMDFITDLPELDGYDTILVVIDRLTKMSYFISCRKDLDA